MTVPERRFSGFDRPAIVDERHRDARGQGLQPVRALIGSGGCQKVSAAGCNATPETAVRGRTHERLWHEFPKVADEKAMRHDRHIREFRAFTKAYQLLFPAGRTERRSRSDENENCGREKTRHDVLAG